MSAKIVAIDFYLPEQRLSNSDLAQQFEDWSAEKIQQKTGINERRIAADNEYASDLAVKAAQNLFAQGLCQAQDVEFILFCTQSPDYLLPSTACLIQERLGCRTAVGALDFNLGCSGFVYGLALAKGLIESKQVRNVLLLTADTYSKYIASNDKSTKTIFGDGAAATWIVDVEQQETGIHPVLFGTDGKGAANLMVAGGGLRNPQPTKPCLKMEGTEIFNFTLQTVPTAVQQTLQAAALSIEQIDLFIFHQANQFMLDHLRRKLAIPTEKFYVDMSWCGNTVSSSIPIAIKTASRKGLLAGKHKVMLVGFGVGYSWAASIVDLADCLP